jgi:hypothetical protein
MALLHVLLPAAALLLSAVAVGLRRALDPLPPVIVVV